MLAPPWTSWSWSANEGSPYSLLPPTLPGKTATSTSLTLQVCRWWVYGLAWSVQTQTVNSPYGNMADLGLAVPDSVWGGGAIE